MTASNAEVASTCNSVALMGKRQNKTQTYVSGVTDTRGFLTWIRASCDSSLSSQIKGETADGFRTTVNALRSLDGSKGVGFHTVSLPEDSCLCLLITNMA